MLGHVSACRDWPVSLHCCVSHQLITVHLIANRLVETAAGGIIDNMIGSKPHMCIQVNEVLFYLSCELELRVVLRVSKFWKSNCM